MADTLHAVHEQLAEFRSDTNRQAWLVQRIRERCLRENAGNEQAVPRLLRTEAESGGRPEVVKIEAFIVAQRFSLLPEPERSALALFYVDLFQPEEIAKLLKMNIEQLGATLGRARALLAESMQETAA